MDLFSKLKAMKIMLIDDDEWIRDSMSIFFESEGSYLLALETAEEAMEALKGHDYDIYNSRLQTTGYGWSGVSQADSRAPSRYHEDSHNSLWKQRVGF